MYLKLIAPLLFLIPSFASAHFVANIRQNEARVMVEPTYIFLNHATSDWDPKRITEPAILDLLAYSRKKKIPSIATVHTDGFLNQFKEADLYFVSNKTVDFVMHSEGGQHRLKFPNAKSFLVGGGNLHVCLCESLRDLVSGVLPASSNKSIYLVKEAIFDNDFDKMPENEVDMTAFVDGFLFPDFKCPSQVSTGFGPIDTSSINLEFYYHGKLLRRVPSHHENARTVSIRYESWGVIRQALAEPSEKSAKAK